VDGVVPVVLIIITEVVVGGAVGHHGHEDAAISGQERHPERQVNCGNSTGVIRLAQKALMYQVWKSG
jgi:hypothetical protein